MKEKGVQVDVVEAYYEKRDVDPPCECVDYPEGFTIDAGENDGIALVDGIIYVTVGVKEGMLDADDIRLGLMTLFAVEA